MTMPSEQRAEKESLKQIEKRIEEAHAAAIRKCIGVVNRNKYISDATKQDLIKEFHK